MSEDELTLEEQATVERLKQKWVGMMYSTSRADRESAEEGARRVYRAVDLDEPEVFIWVDSPYAGMIAANVIEDSSEEDLPRLQEKIDEALTNGWFGKWRYVDEWETSMTQAPTMAVYEFMAEHGYTISSRDTETIEAYVQLYGNCHWYFPFEKAVVLVDYPEEVHLDDDKNLHNENGPSLGYRDGYATYHIHGERKSRREVLTPR